MEGQGAENTKLAHHQTSPSKGTMSVENKVRQRNFTARRRGLHLRAYGGTLECWTREHPMFDPLSEEAGRLALFPSFHKPRSLKYHFCYQEAMPSVS